VRDQSSSGGLYLKNVGPGKRLTRSAASALSNPDSVLNCPRFVRYLEWMRNRQVERLDYSIDNLCARLERVYLAGAICCTSRAGKAGGRNPPAFSAAPHLSNLAMAE
jgi:hypothetical protein